ncbi:MAG: PD-(D/E)XK nuclease family protein, partial [Pyramidobacter sp.]|nr:PD-(D/E)XK nuclease family protein [Pyramidobacter sp.]
SQRQGEAARRDNSAWTAAEETRGPDVTALAARPRTLKDVSATSFALWRMCPAAWRVNSRQRLDLSWNAAHGEAETGESVGGTGLGSVAHWLLSKWDFSDAGYLRLLGLGDGHLRPEFRSVWRDPRQKKELADFLAGFRTADGEKLRERLRKAHEAGELRREFPFRVSLGRFDLTGAVDAFWIERDGMGAPARLCVRDYKTTRRWNSLARQKWQDDFYAAQLAFYAFALRRAFPEYAPLELDLALWNLRSGAEQKLPAFSGEMEQELENALRRMAEQAAYGPWPADRARCDGCAYARGCVFREEVWGRLPFGKA